MRDTRKIVISFLFVILIATLALSCRTETLANTSNTEPDSAAAASADLTATAPSLADQQAELETQRQELALKEQELAVRAAEIESLEQRLDSRRAEQERRERELARRDRELAAQVSRLDDRLNHLEAAQEVAPEPEGPSAERAAEPPIPQLIRVTLAAGTTIPVELTQPLSSRYSRSGDTFRVQVTHDIEVDGKVAVAAGSSIHGTVVEAVPLKKVGGQAALELSFTDLRPAAGKITPIQASYHIAGRKEGKRDAATIGGAAAGGAVLGRVLDDNNRDRGAVIGAIVGAAAGTAIAAKNNQEIELPAGTFLELVLEQPAYVVLRADA